MLDAVAASPMQAYGKIEGQLDEVFLTEPTLHKSINSNEEKGELCYYIIVWNNSPNSLE